MAFYCCPYILRTREVCNRGCYDPKGCKVHRDSPIRFPCKEDGCGKLTFSTYGFCDDYTKKYQSRDQYQREKLEKMAQMKKVIAKNIVMGEAYPIDDMFSGIFLGRVFGDMFSEEYPFQWYVLGVELWEKPTYYSAMFRICSRIMGETYPVQWYVLAYF
ncbi:hypothetical protein Glove_117g517 [Diversispora epigaea]|uniref:Uncharacterized protein n=1 Tax=Diversispora epigaea TaxID=1348612 RepID=A0A397J0S6_9GLOM|nr:hypothetical protein Glove_117g517 [Diversispora epigaea]